MSTFPRSPKLLKGALVEFSERFIGPVPNVIVFQYNPETMTRTLRTAAAAAGAGDEQSCDQAAKTAQPCDPEETFNLTLELDAADALEQPDSHPVAVRSGVADRIAALEMLLYPKKGSLIGGLLGSVGGSLGGAVGGALSAAGNALGGNPVPRDTVPVVLFVWGPGRIVPVRLTSFSVEEQAYSPLLYPIRATVTVALDILTDKVFPKPRKIPQDIAVFAYYWTKIQKQALAATKEANRVESILGMLPI